MLADESWIRKDLEISHRGIYLGRLRKLTTYLRQDNQCLGWYYNLAASKCECRPTRWTVSETVIVLAHKTIDHADSNLRNRPEWRLQLVYHSEHNAEFVSKHSYLSSHLFRHCHVYMWSYCLRTTIHVTMTWSVTVRHTLVLQHISQGQVLVQSVLVMLSTVANGWALWGSQKHIIPENAVNVQWLFPCYVRNISRHSQRLIVGWLVNWDLILVEFRHVCGGAKENHDKLYHDCRCAGHY